MLCVGGFLNFIMWHVYVSLKLHRYNYIYYTLYVYIYISIYIYTEFDIHIQGLQIEFISFNS